MARHTGENEQVLRKILDMTRLLGIVVLVAYFYNLSSLKNLKSLYENDFYFGPDLIFNPDI